MWGGGGFRVRSSSFRHTTSNTGPTTGQLVVELENIPSLYKGGVRGRVRVRKEGRGEGRGRGSKSETKRMSNHAAQGCKTLPTGRLRLMSGFSVYRKEQAVSFEVDRRK